MYVSKLTEASMNNSISTLSLLVFVFIGNVIFSQENNDKAHMMRVNLIVDASCAKCQFGNEKDKECLLALNINSEIYYVEGASIDDHGDAHRSDGFCSVIRKAHVEGVIDGNKFFLDRFSLLKYQPKNKLYSD